MEHERSATIYSVAASAGVSIATVSRVLKDRDAASPALRDRVLQAVEELDYVPRQSARSLAEGAHQAYGLVVGDLVGAYYPPLVIGFEATAGLGGRSVVLQVADSSSEPALAARDLLSRVDALAIGPSALPDEAVERLGRRVPVVVVGRRPIGGLDAVVTESAPSARALVEHLVGHGRRRLQFAGSVDGSWDAAQRFAGVEQARIAAGLESLPPLEVPQTEEAGVDLADRLAVMRPVERPDAVLCGNDELALALVHRLRALGIDVPRTIAVTGWGDVHAARYLTPGLTTVRQPVAELGRIAGELLARRLDQPDAEPIVRTLPTDVVIRETCGGHV
jgi:LacI family transcriptional regulator